MTLARLARRVIQAALVALACVVALGSFVWFKSERIIERRISVSPVSLSPVVSQPALSQGRHLVEVIAQCTNCHGQDLGGRALADNWLHGRLYSTNLTRGSGGVGRDYSEIDWIRAIRHGIGRGGRPLYLMPAKGLRHLGDDDLRSIIAYIESRPPVDRETPQPEAGPLTRVVLAAGAEGELIAAEHIDHARVEATAPPPAETADYGFYLIEIAGCRVCHGPELRGGRHPLSLPEEPTPPGLHPGSRVAGWSRTEFLRTMRTGITPTGQALRAEFMPFDRYGQMSDLELGALWSALRVERIAMFD